MDERLFILSLAKNQCLKELSGFEKRIEKLSDKLSQMNDNNSTIRNRAVQRASLSTTCEARDRWQNRIDLIDKWQKEINS